MLRPPQTCTPLARSIADFYSCTSDGVERRIHPVDAASACTAICSCRLDKRGYKYRLAQRIRGRIRRSCRSLQPTQTPDQTWLTVPCRLSSNSSQVGTEPVWCKVWKNDRFMALSLNSQVHGVGKTLSWVFDPFTVDAGQEYKFLFYKESSKDLVSFSTDFSGCFHVVSKDSSDGVGMIGSGGGYGISGATEWQPLYKIVLLNPRYSPATHATDSTVHLSAEEKSDLADLLANKDALLALINP